VPHESKGCAPYQAAHPFSVVQRNDSTSASPHHLRCYSIMNLDRLLVQQETEAKF
jgi:hypothetical protein